LQDARNKIRTKLSQFETNESYDSVLKDSNYQKNKLFLDVLNTAIAERGEIDEKEDQDNDGDNDFDDVKIARMMASGMSKPEAIAKVKGKNKKANEGDGIYHDCAKSFKHPKLGECKCIPGQHTLLEDGTVTHYDVKVVKNGKRYIVRNVPIAEATDIVSEGHKHASKKTKSRKMKEGISPVPNKGKCPSGWELSPDGKKCLRKNLAGKGEAKPRYQMDDSVLKDEGKAIIENYFKHLLEGEEDKAEIVMAAKDMVDRVTSWMEDTAEMQAESMLELGDAIRDEMGQAQSETYIQTVKPGLESLYQSLEATRASLTSGVAKLTGEEEPAVDMGAEAPGMDAGMDAEEPMAEPEDDFGAAEPAAGGEEEAGRAKRESIQRSVRLGQILSSKKK